MCLNTLQIPVIKKALQISSAPIKIIAAPWIAPQRMLEPRYEFFCRERCKKLKPDYYSTYAEYIIKYVTPAVILFIYIFTN